MQHVTILCRLFSIMTLCHYFVFRSNVQFHSKLKGCAESDKHSNPEKSSSTARAERAGTRTESRFRLSPKRTSQFKSVGASVSRMLAAEVCASAWVMLDTPRSEVA